jgi:hypothetical protein
MPVGDLMRPIAIAVLAWFVVGAQGAPPPAARIPVVLELFTSEGCSSCPPADDVLSALAKQQPVPGVQVIALGMHVTYWDNQGWKDPASLVMATERQQEYGRVFGPDRMYTPQAVIDGREELVGSDASGVKRAIVRAAQQPHAHLSLKSSLDGDALSVQVTVIDLPAALKEPLEAKLLITEDDLTSIVKRGENGGRTLHNDAVVRLLSSSTVGDQRALMYHVALAPAWRRDRLHVNALLQGKKTLRIWGAASAPVK